MTSQNVIERHRAAGRRFEAAGVSSFHGIGGPIGFELAAAMPQRIASLTVLDTLVEVDTFERPWSMEPFARRRIGEVYLRALSKPVFRTLMRLQGIRTLPPSRARRSTPTSTCCGPATGAEPS